MATTRQIRERDGGRCRRCWRTVQDGDGSVHHRKLRSQGGDNDPPNLVLLCGTGTTGCHGWVHDHPKWAREAGWIVPSVGSPADVPVLDLYGRLWMLVPEVET